MLFLAARRDVNATQVSLVLQRCRTGDAHVQCHGITNAVLLGVGANYVIALLSFWGR